MADGHRDPRSASNQPLQGESNFGDSSGKLFSIYSNVAKDEDNKMVERWQKDADGILIFVSSCVGIHDLLCVNWSTIDRSILSRSCCTPFCYRPGPEAKQSGYLCILSWQHLRRSRRSERNTPLAHRETAPVLSSEICCLGQFTLVLEPGDEPQLCSVGNIASSMGASIYPSHSA